MQQALTLLVVARDASRGFAGYQQASLIAVLFSAIALEGMVNWLLEAADVGAFIPPSHELRVLQAADEFMRSAEAQGKFQTREKIRLIVRATGHDPRVILGKSPFQGASILMTTRNALVHYRSESSELIRDADGVPQYSQRKLLDQICGAAHTPVPSTSQPATIMDLVARPAVGVWAFGSPRDASRELIAMLKHEYLDEMVVSVCQ